MKSEAMNYEQASVKNLWREARAKADIAGLKERARAHREKGMKFLEGENGEQERWKGLEQLGHATKTERWIEMLENEHDPMWRAIEKNPKQERAIEVEKQSLTKVRQYVLDGEICRSDRYMHVRPHRGAVEYGAGANQRRVSDKLTFR